MSFCPRSDDTTVTNYSTTSTAPVPVTQSPGTPGTKTVDAPAPRTESCGAATSTVVTGPGAVNPPPPGGNSGTSTTVTTQVPGPAGPMGKGFLWKGEWAISEDYKAQSDDNPLADVVFHNGSCYVCVTDNRSDNSVAPEAEPGNDYDIYWNLVAKAGELPTVEKDWIDTLKDDVFDWIKHASIGDLLLAGVAVAGVIWAGSEIVKMFTDDGSGDGDADKRYDGSDGFVLTGYTSPDIKDVLASLCQFTGASYDVSALPDAPCEFVIGNATSVRSVLGQLALAYQFDMVDTGGILKFKPRTTTAVKTIDDEDLAFVSDSNNLGAPFTNQRQQGTDLPKKITLSYFDSALDYDVFTQESDLFVYEQGQDVSLSTPVTLTAARAKEVAELTLINSHLERSKYTFSTGYKHIDLEPSDVVESPSMGLIRIQKINETQEGIIEFEATDAGGEQAVQGSNLTPVLPPASTNIPLEIGYSQGLFIDPPALDDQDKGIRIFAAVHGYDRAGWPGAQIYVSSNDGATYELVTSTRAEATIGLVETAAPSADYHVWDNTSVITVKLKTNELLSVSELDVLNGKNWCMIGQEVIGFKNAVLTAPKTYQLSGLLRGRRGSEQYVGSHVANELFVLLDDALVRIDWDNADRSTTKKYKVVTMGSSIDKADPIEVQMYSNNTLSWPVTNAKVLKTGSDWTFSWKESIRFDDGLRDFTLPIHDDDWGGYGIIIYENDGVTIKKTYTTQSESFIYTSNMQIADFGVAQNSIKSHIAQLSNKWGTGYPVSVNS